MQAYCSPNQNDTVCGFVDSWVGYNWFVISLETVRQGWCVTIETVEPFIKALLQYGFTPVITFLAE